MLSISRRQCSLAAAVLWLLFSIGEPARVYSADKPPSAAASAVDPIYVRAHYTKYEYRIPMRDGVKLFTAVYAPKDDSLTLSDSLDAHSLQREAVWRR